MAKARKNRKPKGSSKAGRPKKDGARFPSGKLRPSNDPNARVVEMRRGLLQGPGGDATAKLDLTTASDPLDLAHAKGWITDAEHKAARTLGRLYRQAGFGAPKMSPAGLSEVQPSLQIDARSFATMSDEDIGAVWDKIFCDEGDEQREERAESATLLWGKIMSSLPGPVQAEVFSVCIAGSWPQWVIRQASGSEVPEHWAIRKRRLLEGLGAVRSVMRKARPAPPAPITPPRPVRSKAPKIEQPLAFVDESGEPVEMCSEHGRPFEVSRLVRRA